MHRYRRFVAVAVALALAGPPPSGAQTVRLTAPASRIAEEFSAVRGVRELPDGRLLVSDYRDQRVVVVDFDRGTVALRVSKGAGPAEARLPTLLIAAPGDSTLLTDLGNQRIAVLDADGRVRRTIAGGQPGIMGVRGVDPAGRYYFAIPGWMERDKALAADSVRLVRWDPATDRQDDIAVIQGERMRSDAGKPALVPRIPIIGYASRDAWVLGEGGVVWIVRGADFRVEVVRPGAPPVVGTANAYETARVSAADRNAFVRRFNEASPTSGRGEGGGFGFSPAMTDREIREMAAQTEFAERHPMFSAGDVVVAPGGRLWVGLPVATGAMVRYQVFDETGARRMTVELPPGRRVWVVGRRYLYAVAETDDGLQYLERYARPG